jgi:hypothetical protein
VQGRISSAIATGGEQCPDHGVTHAEPAGDMTNLVRDVVAMFDAAHIDVDVELEQNRQGAIFAVSGRGFSFRTPGPSVDPSVLARLRAIRFRTRLNPFVRALAAALLSSAIATKEQA